MLEPQKVRLPILQASAPAALEPFALPAAPFFPKDLPPIDFAALRLDERPTLRTSSYTIYVDLPGNADEMLLVHSYTGAYDKVTRRVATYLRSLEIHRPPKPLYGEWSPEPPVDGHAVPPSDVTIQTLKKRGYLTTMTTDEEEAFFGQTAAKFHHASIHKAPAYILMPTYQCNLRCHYCFQDHMRTDPAYRHLLRVIDRPMVDRLFKGMQSIERGHGIPEGAHLVRNITLFGGEPLLEESRPIIGYIIEKALELGKAQLSAISNATDLHVYEDLLGPEKIAFIQVTIDGPPREHDLRRVYEDGGGTFERIARNVTMALDRGTQIAVRMNVDRGNIHLLPELAEEIIRRGWDKYPIFTAYAAPIHPAYDGTDKDPLFNSWELNKALEALKEGYPEVGLLRRQDDSLTAGARRILQKRSDPLPGFRSSFCGAHNKMYVLDPFGDLYACWERTGDPSVRIGTIAEDGTALVSPATMASWRSRSVATNPVCRKCRYATYCGGGCAVLAEGQSGDMHANHCDGFQKRFRASVAEAYVAHVSGDAAVVPAELPCDM